MRVNKIVVPSIALLFFAFPWACAQGIPMGFDYFAEFGPSCLDGKVHSGVDGHAACETGRFFTGGRLRLTRHDAIEGSYSYSPDVFNEAFPNVYFSARLRSYSSNYVRYLSTETRWQPFATAGAGVENFRGGGFTPSGAPVGNVSQFAWNYGVGFDVIPQRHFAVRFEIRDYVTSMPVYHTSTLHNIVPSIGVVFRWNRDRRL